MSSSESPAHRFAQQTSQEHVALDHKLEQLSRSTEQLQQLWASWQEQLRQLLKFLQGHFAAEERGGYFCQVVQHAPWLKEQVDRLHAQHEQLRHQLTQMAARAEHGQVELLAPLVEQLRSWTQLLEQHEEAENRLLQEAFTQDMAEGD